MYTRFDPPPQVYVTGSSDRSVRGGSDDGSTFRTDVYYAPGLANTSLSVTPSSAVHVRGWPSMRPNAHTLTLDTVAADDVRITLVITKLSFDE